MALALKLYQGWPAAEPIGHLTLAVAWPEGAQ
jgi:hypothetical protein